MADRNLKPWSLKKTARLRKLWKLGYSITEIAKILTKEFGTKHTRSQMAGKLHRLGKHDKDKTLFRSKGGKVDPNLPIRINKPGLRVNDMGWPVEAAEGNAMPVKQVSNKEEPKSLDLTFESIFRLEPDPKWGEPDLIGEWCRYATRRDSRGDHRYCCEVQKQDSPYCDYHHDITHSGVELAPGDDFLVDYASSTREVKFKDLGKELGFGINATIDEEALMELLKEGF